MYGLRVEAFLIYGIIMQINDWPDKVKARSLLCSYLISNVRKRKKLLVRRE